MAFLSGNARKVDGDPIDFVLVFNWLDGSDVSVTKPDTTGAWSIEPLFDMDAGITYVAGGTKPITHGPYPIKGSAGPKGIKGFAAIVWGDNNVTTSGLDVADTSHPNWADNFATTKDMGLFNYVRTSAGSNLNLPIMSKVFDIFSKSFVFQIYGDVSGGSSSFDLTMEFLSEVGDVIAAIKIIGSAFKVNIQRGPTLSSLTAANVGSSDIAAGELSFTSESIVFNKTGGGVASFQYAVDLSSVTKIRFGGGASVKYSQKAGGWVKLKPVI